MDPQHNSGRPMKILHLAGDRQDAGGVLSVLRNLQSGGEALGWERVVWVERTYRETRQPALRYRRSRLAQAESPHHLALLLHSLPASPELCRLVQREGFDVIHAHSRGALLVARLASRWLGRRVIFTNHHYARHRGLYRWPASGPVLWTPALVSSVPVPLHQGPMEDLVTASPPFPRLLLGAHSGRSFTRHFALEF